MNNYSFFIQSTDLAKICGLLNLPKEDAIKFCHDVLKYFSRPKPSVQLIIDVLLQNSLVNPTPSLVAKYVAKKLRAEIESKVYFDKVSKPFVSQIPKSNESDSQEVFLSYYKNPKKHIPTYKKKEIKKFLCPHGIDLDNCLICNPPVQTHCPHGVPLTFICAICDPEEFKFMTGSD